MRVGLLAVALVLAGCRSAAFTIAEHRDTEDGWRSYLADHDVGSESDTARDRLDEKLWADVQRIHTPLAYRRYLDELPQGAHAEEALSRLRRLRSRKATGDASDLDALNGDSVEAGGPGAAQEALAAAANGDPAPLRAYLARFPASTEAAEVRDREDDLSFARVAQGPNTALRQFLDLHPHSRHRAEVTARMGGRQVQAFLWEERFAEAEQRLRDLPAGPITVALERALCERQARAERASVRALSDLGTEGLALVLADEGAVQAISGGLAAEGAEDVIEAAWLLADSGSVAALDPLLRALGPERSLAVRWMARLALARLFEAWPTEVREAELEPLRARIAARAASAPLWVEEAVLEEGLGSAEVQATLAKARHDAPEDPLPLAISLQRGDLRDPERGLVAEQLQQALAMVPGSEGCARQWLGRLARGEKDGASGGQCLEGPSPAAQTAVVRRLVAITALRKRGPTLPPALAAQLGRLAERDGSAAVRAAAQAALGGLDTLATPACSTPTALLVSPGP